MAGSRMIHFGSIDWSDGRNADINDLSSGAGLEQKIALVKKIKEFHCISE